MDDYLRRGFCGCSDSRWQTVTGAPQVNVAALCFGRHDALIGLAYLAAHGQADRIASTTDDEHAGGFLAAGDPGCLPTQSTPLATGNADAKRGYLESTEMAKTFDWMRATT